ncbi:MAG: potassium channel family protein [Synechococcaceae cyanobacterium]
MTRLWPWGGEAAETPGSFAVIGIGRFGGAVCRELLDAGAEVLALDAKARPLEQLRQNSPEVECRVVDCPDEDALRAAGVFEVETVVVAVSEPLEVSITATLIVKDAKQSRVGQVIARATSDLHETMLMRIGADRVVFPSRMQGARLGQELVRPNLLERLRLDDHHSLEEIRVPSSFVGRSLVQINLRRHYGVTVLAAGPAGHLTVSPPASYVLSDGELLVVMGSAEALDTLTSS